MILIWREDTDLRTWTVGDLTNYLALCDLGLKANLCVPAPRPFPESTLAIETEGEPADFIAAGSVFVVSGELKRLLEEFHVDAEFFELNVIQDGEVYRKRKFYFANILDAVDCFDYDKSEYEATPQGVIGIDKLVLDDAKAEGHHLFMLGPIPSGQAPNPKAIRDVIRCASEQLATRVIESGLTGVVFTKPEHRRDYPPPAWKPGL